MNSFEIEMAKVKSEFGSEILRIDRSILGRRRDYNRRIVNIMMEYNEKRNSLEAQHLDLKLKLNAMSDMKGRLALMNLMAENERNQRHCEENHRIRMKQEKDELSFSVEELNINKRQLSQYMDVRLTEIQTRYVEWIESRKTEPSTEKKCGNEEV